MASSLLNIGRSGAIAARTALEVTSQNIANSANEDYARRNAVFGEVTATSNMAYYSNNSMSGVRIDEVRRTDAVFLQNQARRSGGDLARADAELSGLQLAENAIEQAGVYPAIVEFEAGLAALSADPLNGSLRAAALENARSLTDTLQIADSALDNGTGQTLAATQSGVETANFASAELARLNAAIVRTQDGTSAQATLLDQRDAQLADLSGQVGITIDYQERGVVAVRLGDGTGPFLVDGTNSASLAANQNPDGTASFTLDGAAVTPTSGALAGQSQALIALRDSKSELDGLAALIITTVNDAQAGGTAPDGSAGQPLFSGTNAATIALSATSGDAFATAPAGSPAASRDASNLEALRTALANGGPAEEADRILYDIANAVSGRGIARDALAAIAETADIVLSRETAVDLDVEAANLVRFQQAFQASGRVIEVARNVFDTILGIR